MKLNRRLIANIAEIVIGLILTACGHFGLLDSYWSGMGTALIIVGVLMLVRQIRYRVDSGYKENVDVDANDERNKFLRVRAWSWAGYLFVMIVAFGSIALKIAGLDQLSQFSGYCVCLLIVLYWLSFIVLKRKY